MVFRSHFLSLLRIEIQRKIGMVCREKTERGDGWHDKARTLFSLDEVIGMQGGRIAASILYEITKLLDRVTTLELELTRQLNRSLLYCVMKEVTVRFK